MQRNKILDFFHQYKAWNFNCILPNYMKQEINKKNTASSTPKFHTLFSLIKDARNALHQEEKNFKKKKIIIIFLIG